MILFLHFRIYSFFAWRSWAANCLIASSMDFFPQVSIRDLSRSVALLLDTLRTLAFSNWFSSDFTSFWYVISLARLHNSSFWTLGVKILAVTLIALAMSMSCTLGVLFLIFLYFSKIHLSYTYILLEIMTILFQNIVLIKPQVLLSIKNRFPVLVWKDRRVIWLH